MLMWKILVLNHLHLANGLRLQHLAQFCLYFFPILIHNFVPENIQEWNLGSFFYFLFFSFWILPITLISTAIAVVGGLVGLYHINKKKENGETLFATFGLMTGLAFITYIFLIY